MITLLEAEWIGRCPVCGEPVDYCQGHGELGDPQGYRILLAHDNGNHARCHPEGCDEALKAEGYTDD